MCCIESLAPDCGVYKLRGYIYVIIFLKDLNGGILVSDLDILIRREFCIIVILSCCGCLPLELPVGCRSCGGYPVCVWILRTRNIHCPHFPPQGKRIFSNIFKLSFYLWYNNNIDHVCGSCHFVVLV